VLGSVYPAQTYPAGEPQYATGPVIIVTGSLGTHARGVVDSNPTSGGYIGHAHDNTRFDGLQTSPTLQTSPALKTLGG
jgi:hypothetical protein